MEKRTSFDLIFRVVWLSLCFFGNGYQITEIADTFFKYGLVTTVHVNFPKTIIPPAMEICFQKMDITRWDMMMKLKPDIKKQLNMSTLSDDELEAEIRKKSYTEKIPLENIAYKGFDAKTSFALTRDIDEIITNCMIINATTITFKGYANCSDVFDFAVYLNTILKCYVLNYKSKIELDYLSSSRAEVIPGFLYEVKLSKLGISGISTADILFNNNYRIARLGFKRFILLTKLEQLFSLTYQEFGNILMPPPYPTSCFNYTSGWTDKAIVDLGTCFEVCMNNKTKDRLGPSIVFPGQMVFQNDKMAAGKRILTVAEMANVTLRAIKDNITKECNSECYHPSCQETFFIPQLESAIEYPIAAFLTYILQSPKIETVQEAKLGLVQFVTDVASTFGFWIGISIYSVVDILGYFGRLILKKQIKEELAVQRTKEFPSTYSFQDPSAYKRRPIRQSVRRPTRRITFERAPFISSVYDQHLLCRYHQPRRAFETNIFKLTVDGYRRSPNLFEKC